VPALLPRRIAGVVRKDPPHFETSAAKTAFGAESAWSETIDHPVPPGPVSALVQPAGRLPPPSKFSAKNTVSEPSTSGIGIVAM
jgi:hypothetical protein